MGYSEKYDFYFTDMSDYHRKYSCIVGKRDRKEYHRQYVLANEEKLRERRSVNKEKKKEYDKQYSQDNKEKIKECKEQYYQGNKEIISDKHKEYYHANKENRKDQKRCEKYRAAYGITLEQSKQMILEQDNKCLRCGEPFEGKGTEKYAPVVDHDHSYPKGDPNSVRAILHNYCNLKVGTHNDSIEELKLSIDYLKKTSKLALTND